MAAVLPSADPCCTPCDNTTANYTVSDVAGLPELATVSLFSTYAPGSTNGVVVREADRGGVFVLRTTVSVNNGTEFASTVPGKSWFRQFSGPFNVKWFGAKGDSVTDDSSAFAATLAAAPANGTVYIPDGTYFLGSTGLTVTTALNIICDPGALLTYNGSGAAVTIQTGLARTHTLAVNRSTSQTDPSADANYTGSVGVRLIGASGGEIKHNRITLRQIIGFDTALEIHSPSRDNAFYHNQIYLGQFRQCKTQIWLKTTTTGTGGQVNANNFYGGNFTQSTTSPTYDNLLSLAKVGIRITVSGGGISVNRFHGVDFQLHSATGVGTTALKIDNVATGAVTANALLFPYMEVVQTADLIADIGTGAIRENWIECNPGSVTDGRFEEDLFVDASDSKNNGFLNYTVYGPSTFTPVFTFHPRLVHTGSRTGGTADRSSYLWYVKGFSWLDSTGAYSEFSSLGALSSRDFFWIPEIALGRFVNTSRTKQFWFIRPRETMPAGFSDLATIVIQCFDENGTVLDNSTTRVFGYNSNFDNITTLTYDGANYGGIYHISAQNRVTMLNFHSSVKYAFVSLRSNSSTFPSLAKVSSFGLYTRAQEGAIDSWNLSRDGDDWLSIAPGGGDFRNGMEILQVSSGLDNYPSWRIFSTSETTAAAQTAGSGNTVQVASASGFANGSVLGAMLTHTNGWEFWHWTTVASSAGTTITMGAAIPANTTIESGSVVKAYSVRKRPVDLVLEAAPTLSAPNGSTARNINGGAGSTFYVREGGAWVAK